MHITKAQTLKVGDVVYCPADRGNLAYSGRVTHISPSINEALHGTKYIWVEVQTPDRNHKTVWPSNRLG